VVAACAYGARLVSLEHIEGVSENAGRDKNVLTNKGKGAAALALAVVTQRYLYVEHNNRRNCGRCKRARKASAMARISGVLNGQRAAAELFWRRFFDGMNELLTLGFMQEVR